MDVVIGGCGFIGCHVVRLLKERGRPVRVVDRADFPADEPNPPDEFVRIDIADAAAVADAVSGADVVYHLAANPQLWERDPSVFDRVNRLGTENVIAAVTARDVPRLVYASTESILVPTHHTGPVTEDVRTTLDDMIGPYCRSKFLAEQSVLALARSGYPALVVNPTMPIGPGDRNLTPPGRMLRDFMEGRVSGYVDGTLNFVDVRDVALGHLMAAERGKPGQRYILAGHDVSVQELFTLAAELCGREPPTFRVPYALALAFSYAEEWWGRSTGRRPMSSVTGLKLSHRSMAFDGSRTWRELGGHTPRPLRDSLADAVAWHRARMREPGSRARH